MRLPALVLFALLAAPASAQEAVPDTTPPHLYYPLAVGNEWEYANIGLLPTVGGWYTRREITRDSVFEGRQYFVEVTTRVDLYWQGWIYPRERVLRFDTTTAAVVALIDGGREWPVLPECRFDANFGASLQCHEGAAEETFVAGGLNERIPFGRGEGPVGNGPTDTLEVLAVKSFYPLGEQLARPHTRSYYAAPIGYAGEVSEDCINCSRNLTYARVHLAKGIYEVGARFPVADEGGPDAPTLTLRAFPSPTPGPLAITFDLAEPTGTTAEAFDALGRRVWHREATLGAGRQRLDLDASAWAPGLYLVRLTVGDVSATTRVVRR